MKWGFVSRQLHVKGFLDFLPDVEIVFGFG